MVSSGLLKGVDDDEEKEAKMMKKEKQNNLINKIYNNINVIIPIIKLVKLAILDSNTVASKFNSPHTVRQYLYVMNYYS